ncbi:Universal stress protein (fragment) [Cupriavidus taiwanensis]
MLFLLIPGRSGPGLGGHAAIAGNGSREAARAVADALPWLAKASAVSVLTVSAGKRGPAMENQAYRDSADRLVTWLASHGVGASVRAGAGNPDLVLQQFRSRLRK